MSQNELVEMFDIELDETELETESDNETSYAEAGITFHTFTTCALC